MASLPLADLQPGSHGRLDGEAVGEARERLLDLGFVAGTEVRVIRRGPFGDPVELELRGYRVCLRRGDLTGLGVTLAEDAG